MAKQQRYFIELAYDGTNYHGWQLQPNAVTIQEVLNKALATLLRQPVETVGCGRTDTGVHAAEFFAHLDYEAANNALLLDNGLLRNLNALLPHDIAIKNIIPVHADAHARFDATQRSYEYRIHFAKDPFRHERSWLIRDKPDVALMNKTAAIIMEYTDFSCFSKSNTQVFTNNCKISRAEWVIEGDGIVFHISADRFLRNMVRAIVGTLIMVGRKEIAVEAIRDIIESKNRNNAGTSVPACGLYLTEINYPYIKKYG